MKKWKLVAGVLLVFVFGVLVGSLCSGLYHQYLSNLFRKDPAERKAFILKKFSERLDLTETQQNVFKAIIDQVDRQRRAQLQKNRSELNKIRDESYLEMKKVLNPDQQNTFDELIKEIRDRYKFKSLTDPKKLNRNLG
jgi:Spy/CpxP family protein refolding chaperone